jgi:hypothetical protein
MKGIWIGVALFFAIACGGLGYLIAKRKPVYAPPSTERPKAAEVEDVIAKFLVVDPKLIIAKETGRLATGFKELRGVAVGPDDRVYAVGDKALVILGPDGKQIQKVDIDKPPTCLAVGPDSTVYVGVMDHVQVFNGQGAKKASWPKSGPSDWITSIAVTDQEVFVADFGNKSVVRYDKDGKILGRLGAPGPVAGTGKFEVPSPYFDVAVDPAGKPWVAHTGQQRLETFQQDGTLATTWGKQGNTIDGFSGCCNPSHFALRRDGTFVTTEKGLPRVKVYKPTGELVGVVAAPKDFEKGIHGLDVAVDSKDRILVVDPATSTVRVYVLNP